MSRQQSEATDRWHRATLRPGDVPCTAARCQRPGTAPSASHGKGMRWAATWDEVIDGERKQHSMQFRYREEAVSHQRTMRNAIRDKSIPPDLRRRRGVVTVAGFFPRFMDLTARDRSASSHGKVRSQYTRMIEPVLGGWDLAELQYQPDVIREWQARLRSGEATDYTYSAGTVTEAFALLSRVFGIALGEQDTGVTRNPCQHPQARPGKADRKRNVRRAEWTAPKIAAAYLAPMPDRAARGSAPAWDRYRAAVLLAATTGGMRLGEVMALDPGDIDWTGQTVTMAYSLTRDQSTGTNYFREGKSDAAQRVMTAAPLGLAALRAHMATYRPITVTLPLETDEMYGRPMADWPLITRTLIFSTGSAGLVCDPAYQSAARYGLAQAELLPARPVAARGERDESGRYAPAGGRQRPHHVSERYESPSDHGLHFHALRHFYVSLLHDAGVPDVIIKAEAGHEQLSTVRGTGIADDVTAGYTHPVPDRREQWRATVREIITAAFGELLPDLDAA